MWCLIWDGVTQRNVPCPLLWRCRNQIYPPESHMDTTHTVLAESTKHDPHRGLFDSLNFSGWISMAFARLPQPLPYTGSASPREGSHERQQACPLLKHVHILKNCLIGPLLTLFILVLQHRWWCTVAPLLCHCTPSNNEEGTADTDLCGHVQTSGPLKISHPRQLVWAPELEIGMIGTHFRLQSVPEDI